MTSAREQVQLRRIRQLALERGYRLHRSHADGTYGLRDLSTDDWVTWSAHYTHGWSLDAIEQWLLESSKSDVGATSSSSSSTTT